MLAGIWSAGALDAMALPSTAPQRRQKCESSAFWLPQVEHVKIVSAAVAGAGVNGAAVAVVESEEDIFGSTNL